MYQEHVFFDKDEIRISSTRISVKNKTIAMKSVCSVEFDLEDITPPYYFMIAGLIISVSSFILDSESTQLILGIGLFILLGATITYIVRILSRKKAIILNLESGDTEVFTKEDFQEDYLEGVFNAVNDAIIFRG